MLGAGFVVRCFCGKGCAFASPGFGLVFPGLIFVFLVFVSLLFREKCRLDHTLLKGVPVESVGQHWRGGVG